MKSKLFSIFAAGLLVSTATFTSCNDDSVVDDEELIYGSTQVKSFSLKANANLLPGLDSVFFSIDLANAQIFNADSLPYGTKTNKLVVQLSTDACSKVELNVPRKNEKDTVINYLTNSTDSIDFSNGPVRLHLVSFDGKSERDYTIKVNVHNMVPDSLYWNRMAMRALPTNLATPTAQKSVKLGKKVVCLTADGEKYNVAFTENPYNDDWQVNEVSFGFEPNVATLTATENALFILGADGTLYTSADGLNWTATQEKWYNIYGGYNDKLLGVKLVDDVYMQVSYPAEMENPVPSDFPVKGTSPMIVVSSKWTSKPQVLMLGGRTSTGLLTSDVWGYDGIRWAKLSNKFPKPICNAAMLDYRMAITDSLTWRTKEISVLIAMGGEHNRELNKKVYVSRNSGLDWKEGDDLVQMPEYILPRSNAQAIVVNNTIKESRASSRKWIEYQSKDLPRWWQPIDNDNIMSRASTPITEWDVPYIYLFGGTDEDGGLYNTVWRGVINRLTFKPLQ